MRFVVLVIVFTATIAPRCVCSPTNRHALEQRYRAMLLLRKTVVAEICRLHSSDRSLIGSALYFSGSSICSWGVQALYARYWWHLLLCGVSWLTGIPIASFAWWGEERLKVLQELLVHIDGIIENLEKLLGIRVQHDFALKTARKNYGMKCNASCC